MIFIKYIVLDAWAGGNDNGVSGNGIVEKEYSLLISNYIYNRLNELGIKAFLTRSDDSDLSVEERLELIEREYGTSSDVIVVSNQLSNGTNNGIDIIYALRSSATLAEKISNFLEDDGFFVNDYYQLRSSEDSSKDADKIISDSNNNETIIVRYGNVNNLNDVNTIKNNWQEMAEDIVKALVIYTGGQYVDEDYYTVQLGDTLYSIARKFNTTVDAIKATNNLSSNTLTVGQLLKIPSTFESDEGSSGAGGEDYFQYTVQKGDSLYSIAQKYETTVDEIKRINNLTSNLLDVGQVLKIPSRSSSNQNTASSYIVVRGDSLYSIAKRYNTTVDEIKRLNNLTSNNLSIGQILKVPSSNTESENITHVVVGGDSLYSIARKYNTTVDEIKRLNNLTSNTLSIGQVLKIPSSSDSSLSYINYVVISGDSLYSIARKYNTTVDEIKRLNNLTSSTLSIGQTLKIPK